jgi:hypothetical protein
VGANDPVTADATAGTAPCGIPVEERQTIILNDGAIWTAITDHNGKFRVGGDQVNDATYEVDQQRGRVTFRTGSLSIPSLIENLDTNGFNIFDSTGHVNINDELDVNNNKIVNLAAPTANSDAATKLYVDSQVSVADKIEEGDSKVEVTDTGSNGTITFTTDAASRMTINNSGKVTINADSEISGLTIGKGNNSHSSNTAIGLGVLAVATGNARNNVGVGLSALADVTDGDGNVAVGKEAAKDITTGIDNVAIGLHSLHVGTTAGSNVGIGAYSLLSTTDGTENVALGLRSLQGNTSGQRNIGIGGYGLAGVTDGDNNIGIGRDAGNSITTGNDNIAIGKSVGRGITTGSNNLIIGGSTSSTAYATNLANTVVIGPVGTERMRINSDGRLLYGTTSTRAVGTFGAGQAIHIESPDGGNWPGANITWNRSNDAFGPRINFGRSRGSALGSSTVVQNNDELGGIYFYGADGTDLETGGASIKAEVDGTPGTNDMPSRLVFSATEDSESSPRERWRINNEGILTNFYGHHLNGGHGNPITDYRCQFNVISSATSGTNGSSAVGSGPFDSTYQQSHWNNLTLTYGMVNELKCNYNPSQQSRANIGSYFYAVQPGGTDYSFPTGTSLTDYWTPRAAGIWAFAESFGGYNGSASIRADVQPYYGSGTAFYARVRFAVTSGVGYGYHCDLGGHPFGGRNVGYYVRQINNQTQTGCAGFVYQRQNSNGTFKVLEVLNGSGSPIGTIQCTNSGTSFNTSSDYRLKENVTPVTNGIELIKQMPVKTFNFIGNTETITGFLAHEIQDVAPYAVSGVRDGTKTVPAMDENNQPIFTDEEVDGVRQPVMETVPDYQSVDYSKLTPILTAALQEAIAKIETLEARITALETP